MMNFLKNNQCRTRLYILERTGFSFGWTSRSWLWESRRPNSPKCGYWPDQRNRNVGIGKNKETNMLVLTTTKQTEMWVGSRLKRPKISIGETEGAMQFFPELGCAGPPYPQPKSVWPIPVLGQGPHHGWRFRGQPMQPFQLTRTGNEREPDDFGLCWFRWFRCRNGKYPERKIPSQ